MSLGKSALAWLLSPSPPVSRLHLPLQKLYKLNVTPQPGAVLAGAPKAAVVQPFPLSPKWGNWSQGTQCHLTGRQPQPCIPALHLIKMCSVTLPAWSWATLAWKATPLSTSCHQLLDRGLVFFSTL